VCKVRFYTHLGHKREGIVFEGWTDVLLGMQVRECVCANCALPHILVPKERVYCLKAGRMCCWGCRCASVCVQSALLYTSWSQKKVDIVLKLDDCAAGDAGARVRVCKVRFTTHLSPKREGILFEGWTDVLLGMQVRECVCANCALPHVLVPKVRVYCSKAGWMCCWGFRCVSACVQTALCHTYWSQKRGYTV